MDSKNVNAKRARPSSIDSTGHSLPYVSVEHSPHDDDPDSKPSDDAMHVDFDEDQWIRCIPKLSLTGATILSAVLGIGIGLAISLSPPQTVMVDTTETVSRNLSVSAITNLTNINTLTDLEIVDGQFVLHYTQEVNVTVEEPYSHLNAYAYAVIEFPGKIWISALKLLVLPLVSLMMVVLPSRVDEIGPIGKIAIPLYFFTSCCAAIQGTCWLRVHVYPTSRPLSFSAL